MAAPVTTQTDKIDYSLIGAYSARAIEAGLAEADWYQCPVPRQTMRRLLERRDGPAIRDTILWFTLIIGSGYLTYRSWGTWWAVVPYIVYSALYASTSDSRWHESGHGTAFKTDWMNNTLYEIASFMMTRESTVWRWSHNRHHSDTIIVGRDPEIAVPRPPNIVAFIMLFFNLTDYVKYFKNIILHSFGRMSDEEKNYIPEQEFSKVFLRARIHLAIYCSVIAISIYSRSVLPLMLVGFTNFFGGWLKAVYGLPQHAGLAENVLDHRLNCRTIYLNPVHRYLYWNMNYHLEHHMFPLVPYHALSRLHAEIKGDCPTPYTGLYEAWKEIIPAVLKQVKDPAYHVKRVLPKPKTKIRECRHTPEAQPDAEGWLPACFATDLGCGDIVRFDHGRKTYALYRDDEGTLYATDGICTHGNTHLAGGLIVGKMIECPKHNGRFNLTDGSPARVPICRGLATYPIEERSGKILISLARAGGTGVQTPKSMQFRVVSNRSVATFIKEVVVEPLNQDKLLEFTPGDYIQLEIPAYEEIKFSDFDIPEPFATVWRNQHVFELVARNPEAGRRNNYSMASNRKKERTLRFNVRIATPPPGQECSPGIGSSYIFNLKPGDIISAIGPFGDFHIKPTHREMIYIGGGAGMAPLRAHLSHLLETEVSARKISFWYGARSKQEIFYDDYFKSLAQIRNNFNFQLALSSPLPEDNWNDHVGFIHEVVRHNALKNYTNLRAVEFYLCGPPMMIKACTRMLNELGVESSNIAYDEF